MAIVPVISSTAVKYKFIYNKTKLMEKLPGWFSKNTPHQKGRSPHVSSIERCQDKVQKC